VLLRFIALSSLAFSSALSAADVPKQPIGQWIVHFDDAQCVAERNYGSEKSPLYFALKQPALGDVMQVDIIESGYTGAATQLDGRVQFDGRDPIKVSVLRFAPPKQKFRVHMMNVPLKQFDASRTASSLQITAPGLSEDLALSKLGPLLDVMDQCVADLRKVWNVRASAETASSVRDDAKGDLRRLFSSDDYPWDSVINGEAGDVRVVLLVNEQGRVADCSVVQTSGVALLDAQSCSVLKERAKFVPAIGKDGKPAKDAFVQKINWRVSY